MKRPLCVELFAGTFGWSAGWHELGGRTLGFDIEHLPHHGPVPPGDDLILQDVLTLDGRQFKDASLILCSPPCQEFSYMAMPWTRAKQVAAALRGEGEFPEKYNGSRTVAELTALFDSCFRIQREAIAAAGRFIPMVVENVRGAQPWVGRAQWRHGSYALWGDVPALMPIVHKAVKVGGFSWSDFGKPDYVPRAFNGSAERAMKNDGGSWFNVAHNTTSGKGQNPVHRLRPEGVKQPNGGEGYARNHPQAFGWKSSPYSSGNVSARKAASALIARIPLSLSFHIAQVYFPKEARP